MTILRTLFTGLASAALLIGCESNSLTETANETTANAEPKTSQSKAPNKDISDEATRTLVTIMTDKGVECPAVRGADGELYAIENMPEAFSVGDKLNIEVPEPMKAMVSFCQQGQTIVWKRIELISPNGKVLNYWDK